MSKLLVIGGLVALIALAFYYDPKSPPTKNGPAPAATLAEIKLAPLKVDSPMAQCRKYDPKKYTTACKPDDLSELCVDLQCTGASNTLEPGKPIIVPLDGTWCGAKKVCSKGSCVDDSVLTVDPFDIEATVACQ